MSEYPMQFLFCGMIAIVCSIFSALADGNDDPCEFSLHQETAEGLVTRGGPLEVFLKDTSKTPFIGSVRVTVTHPSPYAPHESLSDDTAKPIGSGEEKVSLAPGEEESIFFQGLKNLEPGAYDLKIEWLTGNSSRSAATTVPLLYFPDLAKKVADNGRAIEELRKDGIPVAYLDCDQALTELMSIDVDKGRAAWSYPSELKFAYDLILSLKNHIALWKSDPTVRIPDPETVKPVNIHVKDGAFYTADNHLYYLLGTYFVNGFPSDDGADTPERYRRLGVNNDNLNAYAWQSAAEIKDIFGKAVRQCFDNDISVTFQINHLGWYTQAGWSKWKEGVSVLDKYPNVVGYCIGNENWLPAASWSQPYAGIMGPAQAWRADILSTWQPDWSQQQISAWHQFLLRKYNGDVNILNSAFQTKFASFNDIPLPLFRDYRGWNPQTTTAQGGVEATIIPSQDQKKWIDYEKRKYTDIDALNRAYNTRYERWEDLPPPSPINVVAWEDWEKFRSDKGLPDLWAANGYFTDEVTWSGEDAVDWALFIIKKYGTLDSANSAWGTKFSDLSQLPPPSASNRLMWIDWNHFANENHFLNRLFGDVTRHLRQTTKRLIHIKTGLNVGSLQDVREDLWHGYFDFVGYGHTWTGAAPDGSTPSCSLLDLTRGATDFLPVVNGESHLIWDYITAHKTAAWDVNIAKGPADPSALFSRYPHSPAEMRENLLVNTLHGQYGTQEFTPTPSDKVNGYSRIFTFHQALARTYLDIERLKNEFNEITTGQEHAAVAILFDRDSDVAMNYFGDHREYPLSIWQKQVMQITDQLQVLGLPLRGITPEQLAEDKLNTEAKVLVVPECNRKDPDVMTALAHVKVPVIWVAPEEALNQTEKILVKDDPRLVDFNAVQKLQWDGASPMLQPSLDLKAVREGDDLLIWMANGMGETQEISFSLTPGIKAKSIVECIENNILSQVPSHVLLNPFAVKLYKIHIGS